MTGPWAARAGKDQLVYECELLPYALSLHLWYPILRGVDLFVFIDNDAARASLAKAFTRKSDGIRIIQHCLPVEESLRLRSAFLRVPSHSNIADGPSRDSWTEVSAIGASRRELPASAALHVLGLHEPGTGADTSCEAPSGVHTTL